MHLPVPIPTLNTFARNDLEPRGQRFSNYDGRRPAYAQIARIEPHAFEHAPNEHDPAAHERSSYAYGYYLGRANVGCLGIPYTVLPSRSSALTRVVRAQYLANLSESRLNRSITPKGSTLNAYPVTPSSWSMPTLNARVRLRTT